MDSRIRRLEFDSNFLSKDELISSDVSPYIYFLLIIGRLGVVNSQYKNAMSLRLHERSWWIKSNKNHTSSLQAETQASTSSQLFRLIAGSLWISTSFIYKVINTPHLHSGPCWQLSGINQKFNNHILRNI